MILGAGRGRGLRRSWDTVASSRLRNSFFSRSLQRRSQVHRQQARPHPDFRGLFSFIPDAGQAEVLFAMSERTLDPIPFFLFLLKPPVRPRRLRPPAQRFERRPYAQPFQVRPVCPRPVFRVPHEVRRKLAEPLRVRREVPGHMLRLVERLVLPAIQEQEAVHVCQGAPCPEFRLLPLLARLDRPQIRPIQAHDPARDPIRSCPRHLPLLAEDFLGNSRPFEDFLLHPQGSLKESLQLADVSPHILQHRLLGSGDDLLGLPLGLAEPEILFLRFPSIRPDLTAQSLDRPDQPAPDVIEKPDVGRELDLLRKDRRVGQQSPGPDDPPLDQHGIRRFLQLPEKLRPQTFSRLRQRARVDRRRRGHGVEPAERLHVRVLPDLGNDLAVAELGHVLEQEKSQDELGVFGRPPDVGKVLEIFELKLVPRDELSDAKPTVPFIEAAPEGEKLGEENLSFTVLGLVHDADLRVEVHGFRGGVHKNRAFEAWIDPQYLIHLQ